MSLFSYKLWNLTTMIKVTSDLSIILQNKGSMHSVLICRKRFLPRCMQCRRGLAMRILSVRPSVKRVHCDTRNSSGDEIANVNFLYDDIVHVLQNTIDSYINSAIDRRGGYVLERMFTKFSEITQCNGHYAAQGHSRSPILVPIESSYRSSY